MVYTDSARELSHEELQKITGTVDIPTCPQMVLQAMKEAQKEEPDLAQLSQLIAADPGLSAAALKLANSPLFGGHNKISGAKQAVERLGIKNTVLVVIGSALRNSVSGLPPSWLESFWCKKTLIAQAATKVAKRQYGIPGDAIYTYALFQDAAIPVMLKRFPDYLNAIKSAKAQQTSSMAAEQPYFPSMHPTVGALLVKNWGLPAIFAQAIRFHHDEEAYDLPDHTLSSDALTYIAVTQVAEYLTNQILGEDQDEISESLFLRALSHLAISEDEVDELHLTLEELLASH